MHISVVVCAYNEEKYIKKCLNSLINQSEKPLEIIVVNNNSTDKTVDIIKSFKEVTLLHEKKQGIIAARNAGFNKAKGDIISRCDADTIVPADWLKKIKRNFQTKKIDALSGPTKFYDSKYARSIARVQLYFQIMRFLQKGKETMIGPNMSITKDIWEKVKNKVCLQDDLVHEDADLAINIQKVGGKIYIDNSIVVFSSSRRIIKDPLSFFIEYPIRVFKTVNLHRY